MTADDDSCSSYVYIDTDNNNDRDSDTVPSSRVPTKALQRFSLFISNGEGFALAYSPF